MSPDFTSSFLAPPSAGAVEPGAAPTFSIVMSAYQAEQFVAEAIESALAQTVPAHEIVVCDDGSTDGTAKAIETYRDRIVFLQKENGGDGSAKNAAAKAASGDFVALLDSDDSYLPERLDALGQLAAARPDLDILTTDAFTDEDGERTRRVYADSLRFAVDDQRSAILCGNFICGHCAIRRETLLAAGGFDEAIRYTTDWDCWIRLILGGARAGLVYEPLSVYRVRPGSLTSSRVANARGHVQTLEKTAERDDLDPAERAVLESSLARRRREAALIEAEAALLRGGAGTRRALWDVAVGRGFGVRTRLKAVAGAVAPGASRKVLEARGGSRLGRPGY